MEKNKNMNLILYGYYGYLNIGDDLMLKGLLDILKKEKNIKRINVIVRDKKNIAYVDKKVFMIDINERYRLIKILCLFLLSDVSIWGGGTCFYDSKNEKNEMVRLFRNVLISRLMMKKYIFLNVGIGDFYNKDKLRVLTLLLKYANYFKFREKQSLKTALKFYNKPEKYSLGADMVFLSTSFIRDIFNDKNKQKEKYFVFSGVYKYTNDKAVVDCYRNILINIVKEKGIKVYLLPCHQYLRDDNVFHEKLIDGLDSEMFKLIKYSSIEEYIVFIKNAEFVISMRLHGMAVSDICLIPCIGIEYSCKLNYYNEFIGYISKRIKKMMENITIKDIDEYVVWHDENRLCNEKVIDRISNKLKNDILDGVL
jgi:polysaccharide pyruvyl transferase WcaK-like protein